jgi:adenosine kinase
LTPRGLAARLPPAGGTMSILVTGSVALDHIMVFEDRFKNHILPDKVHILNVAFLVPSMDKLWGGTGANIAYNLRVLGADPILLATVGSDFGPYAEWLASHGIRLDWIRVLDDSYTAQAFITTDLDDNQITAFHPGAMDRAHEAAVSSVDADFSVGIVAPNGKQAMHDHARALKDKGAACVIDPGQGLPMFEGAELIEMMDGASLYVVNDYEWALTLDKTGLSEDELASRCDIAVTLGEKGSLLIQGGERSEVAPVPAVSVVDPTGCGDAYRAGLLYALASKLPLDAGARIGSLLGAMKVARRGPQSLDVDPAGFRSRYQETYGEPLP